MTPEEKQIVQRTWMMVIPIADTAADLFYEKLFQLDPDLEPLFSGIDLAAQKKKLLQALATTVASLDELEALVPLLADLGRRHAGYGVVDAHYDTVGRALLWTLETGLADAWTPTTQRAWTAAYTTVAETMKAGARAEKNAPTQSRNKAA
ncbi:MAG: hemin receptor [Hyphomicrobiaceae bacterium]